MSGWRVRDKNNWKLIGKKDPQLPQMFYPVETDMVVRKGDTIAARCTMVNNRGRCDHISDIKNKFHLAEQNIKTIYRK